MFKIFQRMRIINIKLNTAVLFLIVAITACSDVVEDDLSKKTMNILAPANNAINPNYVQTFWWDYLDDANTYQLQIVKPNFDSVLTLILDTTISSNKFSISLLPGSYQWRVRAKNGSSETAFITRNLSVVISSLSEQTLLTSNPQSGLVSNNLAQMFTWQALFGASRYRMQVDTLSFSDENDLVYNNTVSITSVNYSFPKDGIYQWRVRAENDTAHSLWSPMNIITIDRLAPAIVNLNNPANNAMVAKPVLLSWDDIVDADYYKLFVYKSDSTSLYNASYPMKVQANNASFNLGTSNEKIYWQVQAIDKAGNEGVKSTRRSFTIQ